MTDDGASRLGQLTHLARVEHPRHHERKRGEHDEPDPEIDRIVTRGDLLLELDEELNCG